jgi:hypothetical protein
MVKFFTVLTKLVFIANYGIFSVAFNNYLNHYDFGGWDSDGWTFVLAGGLVSGSLALLYELHLYRTLEFWPKSLTRFLPRQMFCGIAFITMGLMIALSITIVIDLLHSPSDVLWFVLIPLTTATYFPLLIPFGLVVGLINGVLFRLGHTV